MARQRKLADAAKEHIAKLAHEFAEKYRIPVTPVVEADTPINRSYVKQRPSTPTEGAAVVGTHYNPHVKAVYERLLARGKSKNVFTI